MKICSVNVSTVAEMTLAESSTLLAKDDPGKFLDLIVKVASGAAAVELSNDTSGIIRLIRVNLSPSLISKSLDWI
jgi:hypothetical protein